MTRREARLAPRELEALSLSLDVVIGHALALGYGFGTMELSSELDGETFALLDATRGISVTRTR